jgi:CheY-like chemotaxis protein
MTLEIFPWVLVVDDDRAQVAIVTAVLAEAGFQTLSASSASAALQVSDNADEGISLLVTDFDMPDMSGRTLAMALVTRYPKLKVLYLTAHAEALFRQTHLLEPHEAFLEKPVSASLLREAVNLLLHQG